jgi:hypothetical protein
MCNLVNRALIASFVTISAVCTPSIASFAQPHSSHHHIMVGLDGLPTLTSGTYSGLANPNYGRLSLLFPHQHDPVAISHFHAIGIYSYTGTATNPTVVDTSTNNRLPETRFNLPPIPLFPGSGIFAGKRISQKTETHMYSDLKIRPVAHLTDDLADPYVNAIYNTGNGRWNGLLGDEATIALQLVEMTPGLTVTNASGMNLFSAGNDTYNLGQGDWFAFTPVFSVDENAPLTTYSATFRFVDTNTANGRTPLLASGTFSLDFQAVPEPSSLLGIAGVSAIGLFGIIKRKNRNKP